MHFHVYWWENKCLQSFRKSVQQFVSKAENILIYFKWKKHKGLNCACMYICVYICVCIYICTYKLGFPSDSAVKNPPSVQETQETRVRPVGQGDPLEEGMATHSSNSSILAWRIPRQRSLAGLHGVRPHWSWKCGQDDKGWMMDTIGKRETAPLRPPWTCAV